MDDATVIRFPTERRIGAAASPRAEASRAQAAQAAPAREAGPAAGEPFAFLSIEIRRLPLGDSSIDGGVAGRVLNRCVLSALDVLSKQRSPVDLSGTVLRPVVQVTFGGPAGAVDAATAGLAVRDAVRKVQRETEDEFHVFGAITAGTTCQLETGVRVVTGWPQQAGAHLREHATPGQILLADDVWRSCREAVEVEQRAVLVTLPGSDPIPSYPLTSIR